MASQHRLFHSPNLYGQVRSYDPHTWGENIGYGGTISKVVQMWKRSAGHRHNLLNRAYRPGRVGGGPSRRGLWVTVIFYG